MDKAKILLEILNGIGQFPQKDKKDVKEFIEHDEWGIALETICSVILDEKILIHKQIYKRIIDVGNEMEMDSSLWESIAKMLK